MSITRTLRSSMRGKDVKQLQQLLIDTGYGALLGSYQDDGAYGPRTKRAVEAFQRDHELEDDGVAGRLTLAALKQQTKEHRPDVSPKRPDRQDTTPERASYQAYSTLQTDTALPATPTTKQPHITPYFISMTSPSGTTQTLSVISERVIHAAQAELGKGEAKRDNCGPEVDVYKKITGHQGNAGAWCADFTSYVLHKNVRGLIKPDSLAKGLMRQFKTRGAFHKASSGYTPKTGDLIFFDRGEWKGHVGFVEHVDANGTVYTIEGNKADAQYDKLSEDHPWDKRFPDKVRRVSYTPQELTQKKLLGYGEIDAMHEATLGALPSPATPAQASLGSVVTRRAVK